MKDYYTILDQIKKQIGTMYLQDHSILNNPGRSLACKLDPFYYLAPLPLFFNVLSHWSGHLPQTIKKTLLITGNIVSSGKNKEFCLTLDLKPSLHQPIQTLTCCFVLADFIDSSLKIYGLQQTIPPVSELKLMDYEREKVKKFLATKTDLQDLAFTRQGADVLY